MSNASISIMKIVNLARSIAEKKCKEAGIPYHTLTLVALTSGLDVGLTIMEESAGKFKGLSTQDASKINNYFKEESQRSESVDPGIAIWYWSWAEAIKILFLKKNT